MPRRFASEAEKFAAEMPDDYLTCRVLQHAWAFMTADETEAGAWVAIVGCTRCGTVKRRDVGRYGERHAARYTHPDGYVNKGHGRLDGEDIDALWREARERVFHVRKARRAG